MGSLQRLITKQPWKVIIALQNLSTQYLLYRSLLFTWYEQSTFIFQHVRVSMFCSFIQNLFKLTNILNKQTENVCVQNSQPRFQPNNIHSFSYFHAYLF